MSKFTVRYRNHHMGWLPNQDPEWRYRKTLDKNERDAFDALDEDDRRMTVQAWELEQVGFKFK